jgi:hypothetical protein
MDSKSIISTVRVYVASRRLIRWTRSLTESVDMNGIVHPCTHPEGKPAPETEEEMMAEVFKYTERVVNMARPRKVLMMAIGT